MEYCITINPIPHSQYRTKFDYEWSIEYQLIRNPLVSVNIRSASLLIFKILYYGMINNDVQLISQQHITYLSEIKICMYSPENSIVTEGNTSHVSIYVSPLFNLSAIAFGII